LFTPQLHANAGGRLNLLEAGDLFTGVVTSSPRAALDSLNPSQFPTVFIFG